MSKNLIVIIGILLIWFLMIRKNDETETTNQTTADDSVQTQSTESALKMSKLYTL